jgi:ubiquinone/menaquinone biosynthesis C-methylase UbiE
MSMDPKPDAKTWTDLNATEDSEQFANYLDTVRSIAAAGAYKRRSVEMCRLTPGDRAVDVGCGTGDDAAVLARIVGAQGEVTGLDFSEAMVQEAGRRWCDEGLSLAFRTGDIRALDLADDSVDAARADRVFQHLADPNVALAELLRITRPGGRVVLSDPDWGSYIIDAPPTDAVRRYLNFARGQATNPWSGRQLYGLLRAHGFKEIEIDTQVGVFLDYAVLERMGNLDAGFVAAIEAGEMTSDEVEEVKRELRQRQAEGRFCAAVSMFTVGGTAR